VRPGSSWSIALTVTESTPASPQGCGSKALAYVTGLAFWRLLSMTGLMKTCLLSLPIGVMAVSGCSAVHIMGEYGGTPGQDVRLSCRRTYRGHEKADKLLWWRSQPVRLPGRHALPYNPGMSLRRSRTRSATGRPSRPIRRARRTNDAPSSGTGARTAPFGIHVRLQPLIVTRPSRMDSPQSHRAGCPFLKNEPD
jgi:hypothetical protein